jgi:hypothetical protein
MLCQCVYRCAVWVCVHLCAQAFLHEAQKQSCVHAGVVYRITLYNTSLTRTSTYTLLLSYTLHTVITPHRLHEWLHRCILQEDA